MEALISGEGRPENVGKMTGTYIVMQIGGGEFRKSILAPTPWYQNSCDAYMPDQFLGKKLKEPKFDPF